jgi:hypothetical protein
VFLFRIPGVIRRKTATDGESSHYRGGNEGKLTLEVCYA